MIAGTQNKNLVGKRIIKTGEKSCKTESCGLHGFWVNHLIHVRFFTIVRCFTFRVTARSGRLQLNPIALTHTLKMRVIMSLRDRVVLTRPPRQSHQIVDGCTRVAYLNTYYSHTLKHFAKNRIQNKNQRHHTIHPHILFSSFHFTKRRYNLTLRANRIRFTQ